MSTTSSIFSNVYSLLNFYPSDPKYNVSLTGLNMEDRKEHTKSVFLFLSPLDSRSDS